MRSTIETLDGKSWMIEHNLHKHSLDIDAGFINWYFRTEAESRSPQSLCEYLVSKDPTNLEAEFIEVL